MDPGKDRTWRKVMGPHGDTTRTIRGETPLAFCETYGLRISNTYTPQKNKSTWKHSRWGTTHAIDHFMVRREDQGKVCRTLTLHKDIAKEAGLEDWSLYTDHNPIEITMKIGREWQKEEEKRNKKVVKIADMDKIRGQTQEATRWKEEYGKEVTKVIRAARTLKKRDLKWGEISEIVRETALKILGEEPRRDTEPWRKGKERNWKTLGEAVVFWRERSNTLRLRRRQGEQGLAERIKRAEKAKKGRRETQKESRQKMGK